MKPGMQLPLATTSPDLDTEASGVRWVRPSFRPGACIGEYVLERCIGRGGMAEVWRARPTAGGGPVAIKRMLVAFAERMPCVESFRTEALVGMLARHENLVHCHGLEASFGEPYLVMELVNGPSCAELLRAAAANAERIPLAVGAHIALAVLEGLAHLHEITAHDGARLGLVHRDVSPANVLLDRDGSVKLGDFGIVQLGATSAAERALLQGKRGYMAPEQIAGDVLDARADVFSAALLTVELMTGQPPFAAGSELALLLANYDGRPPGLDRLPVPLRCVLMRALRRQRSERTPGARALAAELRAAALGLGLAPKREMLLELLERLALVPGPPALRRCPAPRLPGAQSLASPCGRATPVQWASGVAARVARRASAIATGKDGASGAPEAELALLRPLAERAYRASRLSHPVVWRSSIHADSLPTLLFDLASSRATGLLTATNRNVEKRIYLRDGLPSYIESTDPDELLGARLVKREWVTNAQVELAVELALRNRVPLGEALIEIAAVRPVVIARALMDQLVERFTELGEWRSG